MILIKDVFFGIIGNGGVAVFDQRTHEQFPGPCNGEFCTFGSFQSAGTEKKYKKSERHYCFHD